MYVFALSNYVCLHVNNNCYTLHIVKGLMYFVMYLLHRYWTDNGACYYYTTDKFSNYEEALVAVKQQADKEGIPYRYLQVTSLCVAQ